MDWAPVVLVALVITLYAICSRFWLGIFPISYYQGDQEILGRVTSVKRLPGNVMQVVLEAESTIDPRLQQGSILMTSFRIGNFVYFRPSVTLPKMGDAVVAQTRNRFYFFRNLSLNWVSSWKLTEKPLIGGRVELL